MSGIRFYDLAKELGMPPARLKVTMGKLGITVRAVSSLVAPTDAAKVRHALGRPQPASAHPVAPEAPAAAPAAPAEAAPKPVARKITAKRVEPAPAAAPPEAPPVAPPEPVPLEAAIQPPPAEAPARRAAKPARTAKPPGERRVISPSRPTPAAISELPARRLRRRPRRPTVARAPRKEAAPPPRPAPAVIPGAASVKQLAAALDTSAAKVLATLLGMGVMAQINMVVEPELAVRVGAEMGREMIVGAPEAEAAQVVAARREEARGHPVTRPPIVTVMGHVDHGKTTLLDFIRKTRVTAQEVGGITQHIGAYQVTVGGRRITFIDTPGHEAFTAMRARGAQVTDIAVLVVAADDGVMPQTIEAINHARAAGVPIIVAVNKVDLPNASPDRVKQQLAAHNLTPEEWGGDTVYAEVSAKEGTGVDHLLEMILLVADLQELKADPDLPVAGTVIEAELDRRRGPVATVIVSEGTLRAGDSIVAGKAYGNVRAMCDHAGRVVEEAGPATPVQIIGLSRVPEAGDRLEHAPEERVGKLVADSRTDRERDDRVRAAVSRVSLERLSAQAEAGEAKQLNVVFKADAQGSIEAISKALTELGTDEVKIQVIHAGVGDISESDVMLASAADAVIIGFQVRIEPQARQIAEEQGIDVRIYEVIYDIVNDVRAALLGLLEPQYEEVVLGRAEVRQMFRISRLGTVAGCSVTQGVVQRGAQTRVLRGGEVIHQGRIESLRRLKDDVREVQEGFECGILLGGFSEFEEGDIIEAFTTREVRRETL